MTVFEKPNASHGLKQIILVTFELQSLAKVQNTFQQNQ
jgi:hypothetical protein